MSLSVDGVWKAGVWATTVWGNGVWFEGTHPPPVVTEHPSGGYFEPARKRRTKEDIRAERIRYGILQEPKAVEAVQEVAKTVLQSKGTDLALKEQEQTELLQRMLFERGIALKAKKIEGILLTIIRQEIDRQEKEDWAIVELMFNEL